jgi:essential nuclear protein 1
VFAWAEGRPRVKLDNSIVELYKEYATAFFLVSKKRSLECLYVVLNLSYECRVGKFLSRYTSGKIPKALKRIPSLECWAEVLQLTEPENWSPNAVYQATCLFSSNMSTKNAERFYEAILLPRVRNDIKKNNRLHFALYQSLKKSLYKPAAFNKGILLPLCRVIILFRCMNLEQCIISLLFIAISGPVSQLLF